MQKNEKIGLLKKRAQGCGKLFSKIKIVYITLVTSVIICKKRILKKFTLFSKIPLIFFLILLYYIHSKPPSIIMLG